MDPPQSSSAVKVLDVTYMIEVTPIGIALRLLQIGPMPNTYAHKTQTLVVLLN